MRTARPDERAVRALAYALVGLPLGVLYLILLTAALVCVPLMVLWIGLPLTLAASRAAWRLAALERVLANRLLDARIPRLQRLPDETADRALQRVRSRLGAPALRRALALLALRLPTALVVCALAGGGALGCVALLVLGIRGAAGSEHGFVGPFALGAPLGIAICLLAIPAAIVSVAVADGLLKPLRAFARVSLASRLPAGGPVRETLAQSLGDRTLAIAYWLPDREVFVDERGHPVALPEPGSDRAWTAVDYEGRRVAAIVHNANLDASRELVQAAAATASLAIDNERLKADLRARVEELRASRIRLVTASDSARRKLERDLHDGAQQQLVALAVDLRLLRARIGENPSAIDLIAGMEEKLATALAELRELARGIHPAILTDRGLEAALDALAGRAPLPVRRELELAGRAPNLVEAAAYFVVAEALTNVVKYAHAEHTTIRARQEADDIVVECEDDGIGGADPAHGSGLRGLLDRVGALDGSLEVTSPPGGGTLVRARIPCHAGKLAARATGDGGALRSGR